jgi:hypothetical protein
MGLFSHLSFGFNVIGPSTSQLKFSTKINDKQLLLMGLNIPVEISTAAVFQTPSNNAESSSILAMAHLDTGASITSIDINLAKYLRLISTGQSTSRTAAGPQSTPDFVINLTFRANLSPFINLQTGSCDLGFNLQQCLSNPNDPKNFGILIGRDVMARWNIIWNGPTSTAFISD